MGLACSIPQVGSLLTLLAALPGSTSPHCSWKLLTPRAGQVPQKHQEGPRTALSEVPSTPTWLPATSLMSQAIPTPITSQDLSLPSGGRALMRSSEMPADAGTAARSRVSGAVRQQKGGPLWRCGSHGTLQFHWQEPAQAMGEVPRTPMINRSLWRHTEGLFICTGSFQVECQHQLPPPWSLPLTGPVPWRQPCLPPIDIHFPTRTVQG